MPKNSPSMYDPRTYKPLTFHDCVPHFLEGTDTPRAYLERCLSTIDARESVLHGWQALRAEGARQDADRSSARYKAGRPLSPVDGMPIAVKDVIETKDLPTTLGLRDYQIPAERDSPSIRALREAGAIILGKAVTTELAGGTLSATTNPFDPSCTAGGSSSGSAAVVGACMVPVAIGTQVSGSLIRPASFCGNVAFRPSMGGIIRGERSHYSHGVMGIHAGCLQDLWDVTIAVVRRAGGDPGYDGVIGGDTLPAPVAPRRIAFIETEGWTTVDDETRQAFDAVLTQLDALGVGIVRRGEDRFLDALEHAVASSIRLNQYILAWENRWIYEHLFETMPDRLSDWSLRIVERGRAMTLEDYRVALAHRENARQCMARMAGRADALITLASAGTAPPLVAPKQPDPRVPYGTTGSASFNVWTSLLGVPAVTMPLLGVRGMPVGVQIVAQNGQDEHTCALARWIMSQITPVVV